MSAKSLVFIMLVFASNMVALAQEAPQSIELSQAYAIDKRLTVLLALKESNPERIAKQLPPISQESGNFNAAEKYLLLLLEAIVSAHNNNFEQAINLINRAHEFDKDISKKQLNTPLFSQSYLELAKYYVALKNYEQAYIAKKAYFSSMQNFTWDEHDKKVELLNKKYKTENKIQQNEVLVNQSKLKKLELKESVQNQNLQQINTFLIIVTIGIFLFICFRQLKLRKKLIKQAKTDDLTQLPNRRFLFEEGKELATIFIEENLNFSLIVVDVDDFKQINDNYGHEVGDKTLQQIAILGNEVMRSRDVFVRLGGEEFVAMLPDTTLDEIKAVSERLREKVAEYDFSQVGIIESLSVSIGVAINKQEITHFEELLHNADLAMYQAKSHGKNQVVIFDESMSRISNHIQRSTQ